MDEILTKVGRIGFVSKGEYNPDTQYDKQDIIQYQNTTYAVLQPVQGVTPTDDKVYYTKWVDGTAYVPTATTEAAGVVKPDGETITVDEDGTIHGNSKIEVDDAMSETSENPVQNKVITKVLKANKKNISDEWNSGIIYGINSYAIDGNSLYKCLIQNSGRKPSESPDYWEKCTIADELKIVKNNFSNLMRSIEVYSPDAFILDADVENKIREFNLAVGKYLVIFGGEVTGKTTDGLCGFSFSNQNRFNNVRGTYLNSYDRSMIGTIYISIDNPTTLYFYAKGTVKAQYFPHCRIIKMI